MKKIDLNLAKPIQGVISVGQREINVYEPTIGQLIDFESMRGKYIQETKALEDAGNIQESYKKQNEFWVDEIKTFVPELSTQEIRSLTKSQRESILEMIFPERYVDSKDEEPKKKEEESLAGQK